MRAARAAQPGWAKATAYNRGQVLYRLAEMVEARVPEFAELCSGRDEVERSIDRIVWYAGWADKLPQVLGGSNPVAGPYFNFTIPEPTGVVAVLAPDEPPLLGLVTRLLPPLVGGNAVVAVASETQPLAAVELAEASRRATSPAASSTCSPASAGSSAPILASHMDVNALDVCGADGDAPELERLAAENVKRVVHGRADVQSPWEIASFLELKTVWHPIGQYEPSLDTLRAQAWRKRFSHAIAEGDGISVIAAVEDPDSARAAEQQRAEALVVRGDPASIRAASSLPILWRADVPLERGVGRRRRRHARVRLARRGRRPPRGAAPRRRSTSGSTARSRCGTRTSSSRRSSGSTRRSSCSRRPSGRTTRRRSRSSSTCSRPFRPGSSPSPISR